MSTRHEHAVMSRTILVVDDEPRIVELARDYLEHAGFRVITASEGPAALDVVRHDRPDLVVLDLGLPGLDGLDVTRELRRDGSILPIVMVTARDDELDKLLGLELGADDYLTKPFSPRELVARVKAVLRRTDRPIRAVGCDARRGRCSSTFRGCGPSSPAAASTSPRPSSRSSRPSPGSPAASSREASCSTRSMGSRSRATSERSTRISRTCVASSSRIPRQPRYVLTVYGVGYRLADDR